MAEINFNLPPTTNKHFLKAVVDAATENSVEVIEDVFNQSGAKVIAKGTALNSLLTEKILSQKLMRPLENSIQITPLITGTEIVKEAERLLEEYPLLRNFSGWARGRTTPLGVLAEMSFNVQTATLLKVFSLHSPNALTHGIMVAMVGMGAANAFRYNDARLLTSVAAAGLFHDLGEMYVDPQLLRSSHRLTPREWLTHASHPIVSAAVLREVSGFDQIAIRAITEHHERLDGFGYPRALRGDAFSFAGRMVALAETLSALMCKRTNVERRIDIALKIMAGEYESELVAMVHDLVAANPTNTEIHPPDEEPDALTQSIHSVFIRIANVLSVYDAVSVHANRFSSATQNILSDTMERFVRVQRAFASTGVGGMSELDDGLDPRELAELRFEAKCVLDEIQWRLLKLSRELALKCGGLPPPEAKMFMQLADALAGAELDEKIERPAQNDNDMVLF